MPRTEYEIVREVAAGREDVYAAWTETERFARWFGPRMLTTPVERVSLDVRPGGRWRAVLVGEEGFEAVLRGRYRQVDAPARLVFTTGDPDHPDGEPAFLATLTLEGRGARTLMRFHQHGVNTDAEHVARVRAGWLEFFDRLDEYLSVQTVAGSIGAPAGEGSDAGHRDARSSNVSPRPRT
ncbi:SRPBCC domain-containing protein [Streptomyces sp. NPDC005955]|uniref:SRPBCC family protein n=1 Tax=Streptomyces sp. NPDC005955 TaxID=3364738 RepID=UPI00369C20B8